MADERVFPDVNFCETDTEVIAAALKQDYEERFGRALAPADPINQLIMWFASIISQERSIINIAAKRNLPRYAKGKYLDSLAEIFYGISRHGPAPAVVTMKFILAEPREEGTVVPEGTEVTADGLVRFATTEEVIIPAGETEGKAMAECLTEGPEGNGYEEGAINRLVDQIAFVARCENTTKSQGGTNEETDDELYARARESYEGFTTAGTAGAYKYHAMEHNAAIADVIITEPAPGETGVVILMENGMPTEAQVQEMQEYLSSEDIRPVTDKVTVKAPTPVKFKIDLTYYGDARPATGGRELKEMVAEAVQKYIDWQTKSMGNWINPSKLIHQVIQAGAARVQVREPVERDLLEGECAVLDGEAVLVYGGEDT